MEMLAEIVGGITKDQGRSRVPEMQEIPYLRVANVQRGYLDLTEVKTILASPEDMDALRLRAGDVLFTEGGDRDKLGRGWVWNDELRECIHQNHVFRARMIGLAMESKFVSFHGNTFGQEWFARTGKQTTNLASINMGVLRRFPVAIPPATEQREIVLQVEDLLSVIDAAVKQVQASLLRASRLRQSILKQAFEGKLVPQDPADEPASVLLARIRAEVSKPKSAAPTRATRRKQPAPRTP